MDGEFQKREIGFKEIRKKWNKIPFKKFLQIVAGELGDMPGGEGDYNTENKIKISSEFY